MDNRQEQNKKILVINGNASIRQFLRIALSNYNLNSTEVGCGKDGLKSIKIGFPDLVILDLILPDLEGHQVVSQIRGRADSQCDLPVIILSGRSKSNARKRAIKNGADACIIKPFRVDELLTTIDQLLH